MARRFCLFFGVGFAGSAPDQARRARAPCLLQFPRVRRLGAVRDARIVTYRLSFLKPNIATRSSEVRFVP